MSIRATQEISSVEQETGMLWAGKRGLGLRLQSTQLPVIAYRLLASKNRAANVTNPLTLCVRC